MVSSQSPLNEQYHRDDIVPLVPGPIGANARHGEPMNDPADSSQHIDITAEETCPAPTVQMLRQDDAQQRAPDIQTAQVPSATTFKLMTQLEALASDLAVRERDSSDQYVENGHEDSDFSAGPQATEPSICVTPRPSSFDPFASDRPSIGRQIVFVLAGLFIAALIGVGGTYAWQFHGVWTMASPNEVDVAAGQRSSAPSPQASAPGAALPQSGPVTQAASVPSAPATPPELAKQLDAMVQDLALVRRGVEQLTAKQEQLAAAQQQLEQLVAKQQQLAAKQDQMAQNIAKLQTREQTTRQKTAAPPQLRAAPILPRTPPEPATQLSSTPVPRSEPHPLPPLPIPP
jgi:hypothetical protein